MGNSPFPSSWTQFEAYSQTGSGESEKYLVVRFGILGKDKLAVFSVSSEKKLIWKFFETS